MPPCNSTELCSLVDTHSCVTLQEHLTGTSHCQYFSGMSLELSVIYAHTLQNMTCFHPLLIDTEWLHYTALNRRIVLLLADILFTEILLTVESFAAAFYFPFNYCKSAALLSAFIRILNYDIILSCSHLPCHCCPQTSPHTCILNYSFVSTQVSTRMENCG